MTTLLPKREYKYEALRLFSMLLIIGAHYLSCDNWAIHTQKELQHSWPSCFHNSLVMFGQVGVCLFVLISAYFLSLKNCFSSRRVLKLWIRVEAYSVGLLLLYIVLAHFQAVGAADLHSVTLRTVMISFFPVLGGAYWFIRAFFVVTIASSFLNKMLNQLTSQDTISVLFLLIFVTFVWKLINPNTAYYSDVAYLFSVYVTGYCIRRFENQIPKIGLLQCLFGVIGCFFCVLLGTKLFTSNFSFVNEWGYSSYLLIAGAGSSPLFSFFAAVCIFIFVQKAD